VSGVVQLPSVQRLQLWHEEKALKTYFLNFFRGHLPISSRNSSPISPIPSNRKHSSE
jgi:hypothetical protein